MKTHLIKTINTTLVGGLLATLITGSIYAGDQDNSDSHIPDGHEQQHVHKDLEPLGFSLTEGWLDPWPHSHFSQGRTPFVHGFGIEPAYLDRDLFLDFAFVSGEDENEFETEIELEWALTRRFGLVVEVPVIRRDPDVGKAASGFGDLAIAPRA